MAENLNTKIYDEVKEFLDVRDKVVDDLRDCVYLSRITRYADPWISKKVISFKILNLFIHKVNSIL